MKYLTKNWKKNEKNIVECLVGGPVLVRGLGPRPLGTP